MNTGRVRIHLVGVGGQGTLTATTLLAKAAMDHGLSVVSGEIHGMAQRGGVVESTVLLGGWESPRISLGEADIIMGFEALETLRALPYLAPGGSVISSEDFLPPPGVSAGREACPLLAEIKEAVDVWAQRSWFIPCRDLGIAAGSAQCANTVLLGALCASGLIAVTPSTLQNTIRHALPAKLADMNRKAATLGAEAVLVPSNR
jgi:indolepyruvate ferredoxin oxidoreductase beta subunit